MYKYWYIREINSNWSIAVSSDIAYGYGVFFFQSVTIQEIHTNKYKNIFPSTQIDQYINFSQNFCKKKKNSYEFKTTN